MTSPCEHKQTDLIATTQLEERDAWVTLLHLQCKRCKHLFCRDSNRRPKPREYL